MERGETGMACGQGGRPGEGGLRTAGARRAGLRRCAALVLAGLAATAAVPQALAQPAMKPGLWEVRISSPELEAARRQMQQQLAQLPPAQRARMEQAMGGNALGMMAGGPVRVCHTEASLKSQGPVQQERGCTVRATLRGATQVVDMKCEDGRTGHGEFVHSGDGYRGFVEATDPRRPGRMRMEHEGRWIAADCGDVKPAQ